VWDWAFVVGARWRAAIQSGFSIAGCFSRTAAWVFGGLLDDLLCLAQQVGCGCLLYVGKGTVNGGSLVIAWKGYIGHNGAMSKQKYTPLAASTQPRLVLMPAEAILLRASVLALCPRSGWQM
jgi:hypothetical protein